MHRTFSMKIGELNSYIKCPLCKGYLIDSYTINECLHSFCKSCIFKHIKRKECCPVCNINIIKDRMSLFLKRDVNLQCIVYKIVPELFKKEMKRRRDFYTTHPKALKFLKKRKILDKESIGELADDIFMLDTYSDISLSIEYSDTGLAEICDSARYKELDPPSPKIYLQCPASFTIELLKKFLSLKYDLKTVQNLDVMYDDKPLNKDLTLLDVSYIYAWRRTAPMRLFYRINKEEEKAEIVNESINNVQNNVLTSIENNPKKEVEFNDDKAKDELKDSIINKSFDENLPPIGLITENQQKEPQEIEEPDKLNKPTAKSTPQKDLTQNDASQSRLQIDLSVNNESILKENLENSIKNTSHLPSSQFNPINTSHTLNSNTDNLTITAMISSITKSTNLETVSNSDKENEDESKVAKTEVVPEMDKVKKPKTIKPKKEPECDEVQDLSKKKKSVKTQEVNPNKKPKISAKSNEKRKSQENEPQEAFNQFNLPFSNKINSQPPVCTNYPSNTSTPQPQLPMLQNIPLMPFMYPWKNPYDYNYANYTAQNQQQQAQPSTQNNLNANFLNQKYASQIFDYLQTKSQPYQNFYQPQPQQQLQQQSVQSGQPQQYQNHFNQFNYMDDFKKPLANFASFIQEAANYQSNFLNKSFQSSSTDNNVDSLKETQMKISESCSLVND